MTIRFLSLASGSAGSCYYLGTPEYGILLDAGISCRSIKNTLKNNGIDLSQILAVFITHDHSDHTKSIGLLGGKLGIPLYATRAVHEQLKHSRYFDGRPTPTRCNVQKNKPFTFRDFTITAFEVPHDAADCVGYRIRFGNSTLVLATDVGHISPAVAKHIRQANHLIVEANYDHQMLVKGSYPYPLKERIMNGSGHLCNTETANFLASNYKPHLRNIWLCHLSHNNNRPELARRTVEEAFEKEGITVDKQLTITALQRMVPSELYVLD